MRSLISGETGRPPNLEFVELILKVDFVVIGLGDVSLKMIIEYFLQMMLLTKY